MRQLRFRLLRTNFVTFRCNFKNVNTKLEGTDFDKNTALEEKKGIEISKNTN